MADTLELKIDVVIAEPLKVVVEQADDEALWFEAATAPEAYLQKELRRLHQVIEAEARRG